MAKGTGMTDWRNGVTFRRAAALADDLGGPDRPGRNGVFDFAGSGGNRTWIGRVVLPPGGGNTRHHHGRHEVALYVVRGQGEVRWGDRLEFGGEIGPGDFVYFSPGVPHQELNRGGDAPLEFVVVRSDNEPIAVVLGDPSS
jgi:uncharacterized RmlC-like cupin family protein